MQESLLALALSLGVFSLPGAAKGSQLTLGSWNSRSLFLAGAGGASKLKCCKFQLGLKLAREHSNFCLQVRGDQAVAAAVAHDLRETHFVGWTLCGQQVAWDSAKQVVLGHDNSSDCSSEYSESAQSDEHASFFPRTLSPIVIVVRVRGLPMAITTVLKGLAKCRIVL